MNIITSCEWFTTLPVVGRLCRSMNYGRGFIDTMPFDTNSDVFSHGTATRKTVIGMSKKK